MLGGIALSQVLADGLEVVFEDVHGFNFPGSDGLTIPGSEKEVKRFIRPEASCLKPLWRGSWCLVPGAWFVVGGSGFSERDADPSTVYCLPRVLAGCTVCCLLFTVHGAFLQKKKVRFGCTVKGVSVAV
jgi:hypothetical protein